MTYEEWCQFPDLPKSPPNASNGLYRDGNPAVVGGVVLGMIARIRDGGRPLPDGVAAAVEISDGRQLIKQEMILAMPGASTWQGILDSSPLRPELKEFAMRFLGLM